MLQILQECKLFKECTKRELNTIADICQEVTFGKGESVFEAKSTGEYLYIISEGVIELRFRVNFYNASQELALERKTRGEVFGWSAITKPNLYTLSAFALQNSDLLRLKGNDINELCSKNNHLGYILMRNIAEVIGERFQIVQTMLINEIQQNLRQKELLK